jgi:hypothetical protein
LDRLPVSGYIGHRLAQWSPLLEKPNYAILRFQKIKTRLAWTTKLQHNLRVRAANAPYADPEKRDRNQILAGGATEEDVTSALMQRLGQVQKCRANAVLGIEVLMTASHDYFKTASPANQRAWRDASMTWLKDTFGKENVISATLHLDEISPHIQALVVPVHEGRLLAAHWLDGPAKLKALQDTYAEAVKHLTLERGVSRVIDGEKRPKDAPRHVSLRSFYRLVRRILQRVNQAGDGDSGPRLPQRSSLGQVSQADWQKLEEDLARYGQEGAELRAEAIAGALLATGRLGEEAQARARDADRRAKEATKRAEQAEREVKTAQMILARQRREYDQLEAQIKELDQTIAARREELGAGHLERRYDELLARIAELEEEERRRYGDSDR